VVISPTALTRPPWPTDGALDLPRAGVVAG
jgi:hypothetical protein